MEEHPPTDHRPPLDRATIARMVVIGAIASAIGIFIGLEIDWFPPQASTQAKELDTLYKVLVIATVPIFVLVTTVVLVAVWRFRMRKGEENLDGPPIHGNTRLEVIWTTIPAAMIAALVVYAAVVLADIERKPAHEIDVNVTGQQFAWAFQYPIKNADGKPIVTTKDLVLLKDQPVRFVIHSADVIHALWVPAFRIQIDAVPGVTTSYRITPDRLGTYPIVCTLLCGYGHALMRSTVRVVSRSAYASWLRDHGATAPAIAP